MNKILVMIFHLVLLILLNTEAQARLQDCPNCIPLEDCEHIRLWANSDDPEKISQYRKSVCDFVGVTTMVCCDKTEERIPIFFPSGLDPAPTTTEVKTTVTEKTTAKPITAASIVSGEALLGDRKRCGHPVSADKIIGGEISVIGEFPWMAAFGYTIPENPDVLLFDCAGSLINNRYILTAAHCVHDKYTMGRVLTSIHLGEHNLKTEIDCQGVGRFQVCAKPPVVAGVEKMILHERFEQDQTYSNDIALVRMNMSVDFQNTENAWIAPICLPLTAAFDVRSVIGFVNLNPLAAGWGFTEHGNRSDILLKVSLPLAEDSMCSGLYSTRYAENFQLCVGGVEGKDTCSADSGAPLIISGPNGPPFIQIGIVSYGRTPCGKSKRPAVYTNVKKYTSWIVSQLEP